MTGVWEQDRLEKIKSVMERYSPYIHKQTHVRFGIEDDPCFPYSNPADAPSGKV